MGRTHPGILGLLPRATVVPIDQVARTVALLGSDARSCDIGAGGRRIVPDIVTIDAVPSNGVDVVADIHALAVRDGAFDCVFCTGTLEHVANPVKAVDEIYRILKPGGIVHIDVPFIQGYHPDPTDYWRFTLDGLRLLCGRFEPIESGAFIGPTSGLVWIIREFANSITSSRVFSNLIMVPVALVVTPFKYLDYFMIRSSRSHHVASAVFFRGRKPASR
jgi:SAM-dependent methyltransferase